MPPGKYTSAILLVLLVMPAAAGIRESALSKLQGYTIVGVLTITGYVDKDGKVKDGSDYDMTDR